MHDSILLASMLANLAVNSIIVHLTVASGLVTLTNSIIIILMSANLLETLSVAQQHNIS